MRHLGASLVAVSPQTPDNSLTTAEKNELQFEVLSDLGNRVAREYGLVFQLPEPLVETYLSLDINLPERNGDESWELPIPGTFVVAPGGTVLLAYVEPDYRRRLEPAAILDALRGL